MLRGRMTAQAPGRLEDPSSTARTTWARRECPPSATATLSFAVRRRYFRFIGRWRSVVTCRMAISALVSPRSRYRSPRAPSGYRSVADEVPAVPRACWRYRSSVEVPAVALAVPASSSRCRASCSTTAGWSRPRASERYRSVSDEIPAAPRAVSS